MNELIKKIENKLNIGIISSPLLGKGQCNTVYKLETKTKSYCLKIAKDSKNTDSCELNNIMVEAATLNRLNSFGVEFIPKFIFGLENCYMYEFVDGYSMKQGSGHLEVEDLVSIFKDIACFHYQLSLIKKEEILDMGVTEYQSHKHVLNPDQYKLDKLDISQKRVIRDAYSIYIDSINSSLPQLLHNDPHDENILVVEGKPVFIDFGDMIWRDIHYDFSRYVHDYPDYWEVILLEFEQLSGHKLDRNRIVAISLLRHLRSILIDLGGRHLDEKLCYYRGLLDKEG